MADYILNRTLGELLTDGSQATQLVDTDGTPQGVSMTEGVINVAMESSTDGSHKTQIVGDESTGDIVDVFENSLVTALKMKTVSGNLGALNAEVCLESPTVSMGTLVFQVSGTWTGKIVVEGAVDGTYNNLSIVQPGGAIAFTGVNNDNQNGVYRALIIAGYTHVRLRMSSYTNGTAIVVMNAAPLVPTPFVWQLNPENLNMQMQQIVTTDAANSSTTNLAVGNSYTFTGTIKSTLGVAGIQINLFADKNCTISVQQSTNTTPNWDIVDNYKYYASTNFGITVQATSSYYRVVVTTASLTTTVFRLQTNLCPVIEALPRSLDSDGHLMTSLHGIKDEYGFEVENTPIGEMRVITPTRLVGANFEGSTIDTNFWVSGVANSATVVQSNAAVTLSTTTTAANGMARFYSYRRARYVSGNSMCYRSVIQLSAAVANNKRRWGVAYASTMPTTGTSDLMTDGAWFQFDGTTFGVALRRAGTVNETLVVSGEFNGTLGLTYIPGITVKTYEIYWTNSKIIFVVGNEVLHTILANGSTWSSTMNFYVYMDNVNSNNLQTNHTLEVRVASIRRLGALLSQPTSYYFANGQTAGVNLKLSAGNLHSIILSNAVNNAVITLSDSISAATPVIFTHTAGATTTGSYSLDFKGIPFFFGLRLTVSGANATLVIIYE